jgi:Mn2+/Fe2+ NRAMP family transporter
VINGVTVAPVLAAMMLMAIRSSIMGQFAVRGAVMWLGWAATVIMAAAAVAMVAFWFI